MGEQRPAEEPEPKADCYSNWDRAMMAFTQRVRGRLLKPLLRVLTGMRVRPDHVTLASLAAGLLFCPLYFWSKPVALGMLALHVLLAGLDGPLARHQRAASRSGSFTDSMADQAVITATTITLMSAGVIGVVAGALYIITYAVVVLFAMARNYLETPYSWLIRPRLWVYAWVVVETWLWPGTINYLVWACVAVLVVKVISGFVRIRRRV